MNPDILKRKGARKVTEVPADVLELLNRGQIETVNLTEWLAIDHISLVETNFEEIGISKEYLKELSLIISEEEKLTTMKAVKLIGTWLYDTFGVTQSHERIFENLSKHQSDTIRCYAPYLKALNTNLAIEQKLDGIKQLVADHHFGVREVVWMAIRPEIEANLESSIAILSQWTSDEDENIRRFTTEATRPRGVWCKHIDALKESPELAIDILEKLKGDTSTYVQLSVGNWLNDASKSQPEFVSDLCDKWQEESPTKETEKIIKRARRTIDKK